MTSASAFIRAGGQVAAHLLPGAGTLAGMKGQT